jgi:hypothetical protein
MPPLIGRSGKPPRIDSHRPTVGPVVEIWCQPGANLGPKFLSRSGVERRVLTPAEKRQAA